VLRVGAVLTVLLLIGAYYVPSPIGSNALRLPMLFALPVLAGYAALPGPWLAALLAATVWWQSPVMTSDVTRAGAPESAERFYQPLVAELDRRQPAGRVEVVPLRDHWEATYVADAVPIARGWLRQVDVERNGLFYDGSLTPATYLEWLYRNAIDYVAVPQGARLDFAGREEASLIEASLPYLRKTWETGDWVLYKVVGGRTMVDYPGRLIDSGPTAVRFDVPVATDLTVRVRWSRWLVLKGPDGCIRPKDGWVEVRLQRAGEYTLTSELWLPQRSAC
jgi:hypothetical protein